METTSKILAPIISAQFLLGGTVRLSPWPFKKAHEQVLENNATLAPLLYPAVPFKDATRHTQWVGSWFLVTGVLWGYPRTRGNVFSLGLLWFWTSVLAYGQKMIGMPPWLPLCNAVLGAFVWWVEGGRALFR